MYSGTMIEDLIKTVQQAEKTARRHVSRPVTMTLQPAPRVDLQAFFYQMQTMKHVQVGMA
jgi:hypothetical protein